MHGPDPRHKSGDWLIPARPLTLGVVPMAVGVMRLAQLGGAGRVVVTSGLVAAMAALWMTLFYRRGIEPPPCSADP